MTNEMFLQDVKSYFDGFDNDFIAKLCLDEIKELSNEGRKKVFNYLVDNLNARYKPDLKEIKKAISVTGVTKVRICKKCGKQLFSSICYCDQESVNTDNLVSKEQWDLMWDKLKEKRTDISELMGKTKTRKL